MLYPMNDKTKQSAGGKARMKTLAEGEPVLMEEVFASIEHCSLDEFLRRMAEKYADWEAFMAWVQMKEEGAS